MNVKLKCLECGNELITVGAELVCKKCHKDYPIVNGIPRFTDERYVHSFSMEWGIHSDTMLDSKSGLSHAEDSFFERTGLTKEDLKGMLVLDAGCGNGRYLEIVQKYGAKVIGVDMSQSVEQSYENVGKLENVEIVQADILNLPFFEKTFDIIFSLGVIHHTSDCHFAFEQLAKLIKPNGKMAVWVYSDDGWKFKIYNKVSNFYRIFTTRLPPKVLYKLCYISIPLYHVQRIPIIGLPLRVLLPLSDKSLPMWRVLGTFDWYSPRYQSKHTYKELESWYKEAGFKNIKRLPVPVSMIGYCV
jgi:SAM-dependent methyltransferase